MAEILIVDDERDMLRTCAQLVQALGHKPVTALNGIQAIELLESREFDLILCDLFMPEIDGLGVLERAKEILPNTPFILLTAYGTIDRAVSAMKAGAFDFLEKPFEVEYFQLALEKGLRQRQLFCERDDLRRKLNEKYSFDNIIGRSVQMQRLFDLVSSVALTNANVIITGESGTGKELVAQSIHRRSKRGDRAFIPVNCGALPESIFESELFGYEKGAFTNAVRRKSGLLEMADGGTFFLDEVCELTESLQVKLLRVLQEGQVRRLGGNTFIPVDVRFIAATNRDVEKAVEEKRLREDFYYRLNVVRIHIPPLRERRDDIAALAEHFLNKYGKASPQKITGFHPEALKRLESYDWPGNVRELENTVERAVTLAKGEEIGVQDLPDHFRDIQSANFSYTNLTLVAAKQQAIDSVELNYLLNLLEKHRGNVTQIAEEAGMTRRNLHRLLLRHGLDAKAWRRRG